MFRGKIDRPAQSLDERARLGRDYTRFRKEGLRSAISELIVTSYESNLGNAETHEAACKALQGTSVTVYDDLTTQYDNCVVQDVRLLAKNYVRQGGAWKYRLVHAVVIKMGA